MYKVFVIKYFFAFHEISQSFLCGFSIFTRSLFTSKKMVPTTNPMPTNEPKHANTIANLFDAIFVTTATQLGLSELCIILNYSTF